MYKLLRLVAVNILVFLGILLFLNFTAILTYQAYKMVKPGGFTDTRSELLNYKNIEWAHKHFEEFNKLPAEYRSYIGWRRLPYKGQTININDQGIRSTPQSELATETSPLVVFLGGSTMWGTGSDDRNTIPAHFADIAHGDYRAINLGESGYNAFQGYLILKLQIMGGLTPNIVVSYDGVNEAGALNPERRPFSHARENQIRTIMKEQDVDGGGVLSFKHFFLKPLQLFIDKFSLNFKSKFFSKNEPYSIYHVDQKRVEQVAIGLLESWLSTKHLAEENSADFIGILQPNGYFGNPRLDHLDLNVDEFHQWHHQYRTLYTAILELLKDPRYKELSGSILDFTGVFDRDEYIYIDFAHVSPNGNRIIAEKIYNHIINSHGNK